MSVCYQRGLPRLVLGTQGREVGWGIALKQPLSQLLYIVLRLGRFILYCVWAALYCIPSGLTDPLSFLCLFYFTMKCELHSKYCLTNILSCLPQQSYQIGINFQIHISKDTIHLAFLAIILILVHLVGNESLYL